MIATVRWWIFNLGRHIPRKRATIRFMSEHLIMAADAMDAMRRENMVLRERGDRLAYEIEHNDWTVASANRLCDAVAAWREMGV